MVRRLVRLVCAAALTAIFSGLLIAPAPPAMAITKSEYASQAFNRTNAARVNHDRPKLGHDACMKKWAVRQATAMADQTRMFHQDLLPILTDCNLSLAGENVAYGYPNGRATVRAWMNSPLHRRNILDRDFKRMEVAARKGSDGNWYVAQVFGRR